MNKFYEDDKETLILSNLLRYADHNRKFNREFIDSVYDFFEKTGFITQGQFSRLKEVYEENHVKDFMDEMYGFQLEEAWQ